MTEWDDEAIILSARPHGEKAMVVHVLTATQGRCAGLVAGGQGRKGQGLLQQGNQVQARWRARLPEHLGHFNFEPISTHAARWFDQPAILAIISSACSVAEQAVPERQALPAVYNGLSHLLSMQEADLFGAAYVQWELGLLAALGYGLDLSACAVTQQKHDLAYVSPRSGRAVSRTAGEAYHDKLLHLPRFLRGEPDWSAQQIWHGLQLTGHFLARQVFLHTMPRNTPNWQECLPASRRRLAALYQDSPVAACA